MKKYLLFIPILVSFLFMTTACTTPSISNDIVESFEPDEILFVYDDGRMKLNSRYINVEDVVIYSDGRGGEKAAVKVLFPLHSNFYRDSIIVVRVKDNFDEMIGQR